MTIFQFQTRLRVISDRYLASCLRFRRDLAALFAEAEASAAAEPDIFYSAARAEEARIDHVLNLQEVTTP